MNNINLKKNCIDYFTYRNYVIYWTFIFLWTINTKHTKTNPIRRIDEYKKEHHEASSDVSTYVSNPINAYLLTKRLTSDWKVIEQAMSHDIGNG